MSENQPEKKVDPQTHLSFEMKHNLGALSFEATFVLTQPWTILFAPSGAGKTTILRAIAGLLRPQNAYIVLRSAMASADSSTMHAEFVLVDTRTGIFRKPHQRAIRMVSQNSALFPHMRVLDNVRYRSFDFARTVADRTMKEDELQELFALCRIEHLTGKVPAQLSGGERQRVALARSLAVSGSSLLLLDEPFTGLDAALRDELIAGLRVWLARRDIPVLSVTHDISEAFQLNAEVLKLHDGRITAQGPAGTVLAEERDRLLTQLHIQG